MDSPSVDSSSIDSSTSISPYQPDLSMAHVVGKRPSGSSAGGFERLLTKAALTVDKTAFIREWMDDDLDITLIARPRRFGKTTNITMLRTFFDVLGSDPPESFKKFKIFEDKEFVARHYQQYPVIFVSLNLMDAPTWEKMEDRIIDQIRALCRSFMPVLGENESFKQYFGELLQTQSSFKMAGVLGFLSQWLKDKYNRPPIILADECDAPMNTAYLSGDEEFKKLATSFFKTFFDAAFKTNFVIEKACLIGTSNVMLANIGSGFNNYTLVTILDDEYSSYFGFTEAEVAVYLKRSGAGKAITLDELKRHYDGYIFGDVQKVHLFNPVSVVGACRTRRCLNFWVKTASSSLLNGLFSRSNASWKVLNDLFRGVKGTVERSLCDDSDDVDIKDTLLHFGYLKYESENDAPSMEGDEGMFSIVNKEVEDSFLKVAAKWMRKAGVDKEFKELQDSIRTLNIEPIIAYLSKLVRVASIKDLVASTPEKVYHMMCLTILHAARGGSVVRSQTESGDGYPDIMVHWPAYAPGSSSSRNALIFEFKIHKRGAKEDEQTLLAKMKRKTEEAMEQIDEKKYRERLPSHVWRLVEMGICFSGRDMPVFKYRELRRDDRSTGWEQAKEEEGQGASDSVLDIPVESHETTDVSVDSETGELMNVDEQ